MRKNGSNGDKRRSSGVWRSLRSTKLAIGLLIAITLACILGTLIPQNAEKAVYISKYGVTSTDLFLMIGATDLFHSWWFAGLLGLLGLNLFMCTLGRFSLRLRSAGPLLTHLSIMVILAGAIVGSIWGEKGMVQIHEGHSADAFHVGNEKRPLGFKVFLEDFIIEHYEDGGAQLRVQLKDQGIRKAYPAQAGGTYEIEGTGYAVRIDRYVADFMMNISTKEVESRSERPDNPAIQVTVTGPEAPYTQWLFSRHAGMHKNAGSPLEMTYVRSASGKIKDFKSKLKVMEGDRVAVAKTIEVNDPLRYKGYGFYQHSYDRKNLKYTVLQVVKDPGVPLVYAGFVLLLLGLTGSYTIGPLIKSRQASKRAEPEKNSSNQGEKR